MIAARDFSRPGRPRRPSQPTFQPMGASPSRGPSIGDEMDPDLGFSIGAEVQIDLGLRLLPGDPPEPRTSCAAPGTHPMDPKVGLSRGRHHRRSHVGFPMVVSLEDPGHSAAPAITAACDRTNNQVGSK
jgi:hypothetical protein